MACTDDNGEIKSFTIEAIKFFRINLKIKQRKDFTSKRNRNHGCMRKK